jgi:threonine dehydrogenase-like Zn-dependent dehydrogenase
VPVFPRTVGYSAAGIVTAIGDGVTDVSVGDRVHVFRGVHTRNITIDRSCVIKLPDEVSLEEASMAFISIFPLAAIRKCHLEIGESALVMGLGILGIFAVEELRAAGAYPVIAVDPVLERRELALKLGADYALDPSDPDFVEKVMKITKGKGVNATVEVTGASVAMKQALECASWMGHISLLGCTRVSDCAIDYYQQVHRPGIKLIGAHNFVRPKMESYPHHWTHQDDCKAILDLIAAGRLQVAPVVSRVVAPEDAPAIYDQLCDDPAFPIGTVFDWRTV